MEHDLIVTREYPPLDGGIATVALELARHLAACGRIVHILTWAEIENAVSADKGIRIHLIPKPVSRMAQIHALFNHARRLVSEHEISRIWATTWNFSGVAAALVSMMTSVPYVVFCYGYDIAVHALRLSDRMLMKFSLDRARRVFASSCVTRDRILKFAPGLKNVIYLPPGVDARKFKPKHDASAIIKRHNLAGKKMVLTVARLYPRKGHDEVLKALPEVVKRVPNLVYVIAGKGGEFEKLLSLTRELHLERYVVFTGFVPDEELPAYYAACDVFILPNREITESRDPWYGDYEGFGVAFIEASASGKPVIGGRSGGAFDAVKDGETGFLVNPLSTSEIAEALSMLLTDSLLAEKMGENGRRWVESELDWPILLKQYEKAFAI